jgi:hypothetical protein
MPLQFKWSSKGLSSAIMTNNLREAEFLSVTGSDCGIANVNIELQALKLEVLLVVKRNWWWSNWL